MTYPEGDLLTLLFKSVGVKEKNLVSLRWAHKSLSVKQGLL